MKACVPTVCVYMCECVCMIEPKSFRTSLPYLPSLPLSLNTPHMSYHQRTCGNVRGLPLPPTSPSPGPSDPTSPRPIIPAPPPGRFRSPGRGDDWWPSSIYLVGVMTPALPRLPHSLTPSRILPPYYLLFSYCGCCCWVLFGVVCCCCS